MNRILLLTISCLCIIFSCRGIDIQLDTNTFFRGDSTNISNKLYYRGIIYCKDLSEINGLFDQDFNIVTGISIMPGGGRIFQDSLYHKRPVMYTKIFVPGQYYIENFGTTINRFYDFKRGYWVSNNTAFNSKVYKEKDLVYNTEDRLIISLVKWFFYLGLIILFIIKSINCLFSNHQIKPKTWSVFILILFLILIFLFIDNKYLEWSLLMPIILWGALFALSKIVPRKLGQTIFLGSIFLPLLLVIYQFTVTKSNICLSDGKKLEVNWRRGTDLIKRSTIRNLLTKMETIETSKKYLCKNELTACEYSIISGELMSWISCLWPNDPKANLSLDEAQQLVSELNDIIGFDYFIIPTKELWGMAVSPKDKSTLKPIKDEPHGINKGVLSTKGFVDLGDNMKELTTSAISVPYYNANNISFKMPDYIVSMGGSYYDSVTYYDKTILPRNFSASNLGVRLGLNLSPHMEVPTIYGLLLDTIGTQLPSRIELLGINDVKINKSWEEMERELIELSANERTYTVLTSNGKVQTLSIPSNTEPYIFTPEKIN